MVKLSPALIWSTWLSVLGLRVALLLLWPRICAWRQRRRANRAWRQFKAGSMASLFHRRNDRH